MIVFPSSDLIGLEFPNGNVRCIHRSTLVNAGGYFSACLGDNGIPAVPDRTDEHGRSIYFIEGDGELFDKHILPFILRKIPGMLPPFSKDPPLWKSLREEAEFYQLNELSYMLHVTHSCPYNIGDDCGVLYWLGTGKGTHEYKNPYSNNAVAVFVGKLGDIAYNERNVLRESQGRGTEINAKAFLPESRAALVQYRPPIIGYDEERDTYRFRAPEHCYSLWCNMSLYKIPTIVDLQSISVRLMAYSIRYDYHKMTDWNLEASQDGENWTTLHKARNDRHLAPSDDLKKAIRERDLRMCSTREEKNRLFQYFAERACRHTWKITPPSDVFYRYFRIIGSGNDYERAENSSNCLHGVGLELYGDVHEEYEEL